MKDEDEGFVPAFAKNLILGEAPNVRGSGPVYTLEVEITLLILHCTE